VQTADMVADDLLFLAAQSGELGKSAAMQYAVARKMAKRAGADTKQLAATDELSKKLGAVGGKLEKAVTDAVSLRKQLDTANADLAKAVGERDAALAKARKLEVDAKKPALMDVGKSADTLRGTADEAASNVEPVKDSFGKVDDAASAFKAVHKSGGTRVTP
jgi:hypothetical protein